MPSFKGNVMVQAEIPLVHTWTTKKGNVRRITTMKSRSLRGILASAHAYGIDPRKMAIFGAIEAELVKRGEPVRVAARRRY